MDKQNLQQKGILDQDYADHQIRQVPAPFFEIGQIATPRYDIDFMPVFSEKSLKPVRFSHENQAYAEFSYRPDAVSNVLRMATFDNDYVLEKAKTPLDRVLGHFKFALAHSSVKQILSTLDHRMLFSVTNLQQMVNGDCRIPKVWATFVHSLGNKPSPYGHIEMRNFDQTLLDFMCFGIDCYNKVLKKEEILINADDADEAVKMIDMFTSFTDKLVPATKCYFSLSERPNATFLTEIATHLWNEEVKTPLNIVKGETPITIRMMNAEEILLVADMSALKLNRTLTDLKVHPDKIVRMIGLYYLLTGTVPPNEVIKAVPEIRFIKGNLDTLVLLFRLIFRIFAAEGQPILDRLYKCETFKPSGVGHSAQLICVHNGNKTYSSKVNLSHYPQALGNVLKTTQYVRVVKEKYTTHTALKQEDGSIFVMKDAVKFFS